MTYATAPFGNGVLEGSGGNVASNVNNHYGRRSTGKTQGVIKTQGAKNQLVIDLDGTMVGNEAFPLKAPVLPIGAKITAVYMDVAEAFNLGGTSPVIEIGTEGSEATNGFTITEAQAEAANTHIDLTSALSGTWAAGLTAATTVGIDLAGTTPTTTTAGKARIVIEYVKVADQA